MYVSPECYLAGPMRGYEDFNYPVFNRAACQLRENGWVVHNPAETDSQVQAEVEAFEGHPLKIYMRQDLRDVLLSDCVVVLPGWEESQGASLEVHVAWETETPVFDFVTWERIEKPEPRLSTGAEQHSEIAERLKNPLRVVGLAPRPSLDFGPEERATDPETGGSKGRKQAVFAHIPVYAQVMKARVHGFGIFKYPDEAGAPNWTKGTPWSWMYDAAQRHILAFWSGETINPESGLPHLAHAAWMLDTLMEFGYKSIGTDDRPTY